MFTQNERTGREAIDWISHFGSRRPVFTLAARSWLRKQYKGPVDRFCHRNETNKFHNSSNNYLTV